VAAISIEDNDTTTDANGGVPPAFGTFLRRFQALLWDTGVVMIAIVATGILGTAASRIPGAGLAMLILMLAEVLLYEPIMVAYSGATLGHRRLNLRVVDESTGENPSFMRALLRYLVKLMLGLPSFAAMALTRRHQAIHDRISRTTVRIRDMSIAEPHHWVLERPPVDEESIPSRMRRIVIIVVYLFGLMVLLGLILNAAVSPACVDFKQCTRAEQWMKTVFGFAWMGASIACVIAGWRGRLPGARGPRQVARQKWYWLKMTAWVVGCLIIVMVLLTVLDMVLLSRKGYAFVDGDLPKHLAGRWDWRYRSSACGSTAHVIEFSPDRRVMKISLPPHGADTGWVATYDILQLTPSRLRGAIRGEKRLTSEGKPVVWDLVMFGPNEYHWHRTDWYSWGYTGAVVRCSGDTLSTGPDVVATAYPISSTNR